MNIKKRSKKWLSVFTVVVAVLVASHFVGTFIGSSAGFMKTGQMSVKEEVGDVNFEMYYLNGVSKDYAGTDSYDASGLTDGAIIGDTKNGAPGDANGDDQLSCIVDNEDPISPGWKKAVGFKVSNIGSLKSIINLCLGSEFIAPDNTVANPLSRIQFTVYSGNEIGTGKTLTKVAEGRIGDKTVNALVDSEGNAIMETKQVEGETTEDGEPKTEEVPVNVSNSVQYGNLKRPGQVLSVTADGNVTSIPSFTLEAKDTELVDGVTFKDAYYVVVFEFVDEAYTDSDGNKHEGWIGNNSGDNTYAYAGLQFNVAVTGVGPTDAEFKFGKDTAFGPVTQ